MNDTGCVACIGVFDGVHRGHQALLALARDRANAMGAQLVVITFDPHPMAVVRPSGPPPALASIERRLDLLRAAGADRVELLPFDAGLAGMSPEDFIAHVLAERVHVREVVVGPNFRFGHRAAGTVETLREVGAEHGIGTTIAPMSGSGDVRWSSTLARRLVAEGDVAGAGGVLGRPYRVDGTVVHGDHRGRDLGFPTANLAWSYGAAIPADGVYAGWLVDGPDRLPAAISVGTNPQFGGAERRIEAYVLDRTDLDLYGHEVGVEFVDRIRGQQTFTDVDGLIGRMHADVEAARTIIGSL